jgi:hypothetical protein
MSVRATSPHGRQIGRIANADVCLIRIRASETPIVQLRLTRSLLMHVGVQPRLRSELTSAIGFAFVAIRVYAHFGSVGVMPRLISSSRVTDVHLSKTVLPERDLGSTDGHTFHLG